MDQKAKTPLAKRILRIVTDRWFISAVGAIALAVVIWLIGPLLPMLSGGVARGLLIAIVGLVWLAANLLLDMRAAKRNAQMIADVASGGESSASAIESAASEEIGLLRERLTEAVALLKASQADGARNRQYLYELPWYILIGPPGSGKTTALVNSGLKFPLSDKFGRDPLRGVGGTKNCDWWFSNDAILLDTAGRYTVQDSNRAVDEKAWHGFLKLLKQFRPRQPINGAIVAIGVPDLVAMTSEERAAHARAVKGRIGELQSEFGVKFPVYVLFTKLDLLAGFVEFFEDLDRKEREQVWGATFPLDDGTLSAGTIAHFDTEFDSLIDRLEARVLERVNHERDFDRRAAIFGFPLQIASLKPVLQEFLGEVFTPTRFESRPLLRGIYFSSATQEGTPIDRLTSAMASTFGLSGRGPAAFRGTGRSYFVTGVLRDVIFEEARIVGSDPAVERREDLLRKGALVGMAAAALALIGAWTASYFGNSGFIKRQDEARTAYAAAASAQTKDVVADDDIARVMPLLDQLRTMPAGYDSAREGAPLGRRFGLNQAPKLESEAIRSYRRALNGLLLPRLVFGTQEQLARNLNDSDFVSVFLPLYLMLGGQGPLEKDRVEATVTALWGPRAYPSLAPEDSTAKLRAHLDALLEEPLATIPLDGTLLAQARRVMANVPISARAYQAVKASGVAQAIPEWRIVDNAGPAASQVFVRPSGQLLSQGVPGFFTYDGFHKVFLPQIAGAIEGAAAESWVLGPENTVQLSPPAIAGLVDETVALYATEFIAVWDRLLADVEIAPFRSSAEAGNIVSTLSGPSSPLKKLMIAAAKETRMNRPAPAGAEAAEKAANAVAGQSARVLQNLAQATGLGPGLRGQAIDDHFRPLHDLVEGADKGQSQLDDVIRRLSELSSQLAVAGAPGLGGAGAAASGAAAQLQQQAAQLPAPLSGMVSQVAGGSKSVTAGATRKAVQDLYASSVLPFCRQALAGRYPFDKSSAIDVPPSDFEQLFRPGGLIDGFFTANLLPYMDMSRSPWRNQEVGNVSLGLSQASLVQFERARSIRDAFFPAGGPLSTIFTLSPEPLPAGAKQVVVDVDGQVLTYFTGMPSVPMKMSWPAQGGAGVARLIITPVTGQSAVVETSGPWSVFRLVDRAAVSSDVPDQMKLGFNVGGLTASFQLRANSVRNPFRSRDLERFQCPSQL